MTQITSRLFAVLLSCLLLGAGVGTGTAGTVEPRDGWRVQETSYGFREMVDRLNEAVRGHEMLLVTRASASAGARGAGITIPGNMIVGVYRNDYARRMLEASVIAGIEAPIRFYITENEDGTATLSYKTPTMVFSPYFDDGGDALRSLAEELDALFASIFDEAVAGE